jgi:hypothetical protein
VPRRLVIEPLLTNNGGFPAEYKFFMFNGIARLVMYRANYGDQTHQRNQAYYDMHWQLLPIRTLDMPRASPVPCPRELDTKRMMAERLADNCDHLRVDFLVSDGRVYVGELTSYHRSGFIRFELDEHDFMLWNIATIGVACTWFRRHRVRCFDGAGGGSWRDGSLRESSSLRPCA